MDNRGILGGNCVGISSKPSQPRVYRGTEVLMSLQRAKHFSFSVKRKGGEGTWGPGM